MSDVITLDAIKAAIFDQTAAPDYVFICPLCFADLKSEEVDTHIEAHYENDL